MTGGRHDRTRLFVAEHGADAGRFFNGRVSVAAGQGMLDTDNGRIMLRTMVNLVSRFTDSMDIRLPDGHGRTECEMVRLAESTGCRAAGGRAGRPDPDVALSVGGGPAGGRLSVSANSSGWASYVACGGPAGGQDGAVQNPIGAMGAACLASAEAFKGLLEAAGCAEGRVAEHPGMLALSLLDYAAYDPCGPPGGPGQGRRAGARGPPAGHHGSQLPLPRRVGAGEIVLAGVGAVGSSFLYAAGEAGALDATVRVVDDDVVDETSLNRCPAFFEADVGRPKALAAEAMSRGSFRAAGSVARIEEYCGGSGGGLDAVVSAVDNRDARLGVQFDLPRVVFHGATGGAVAAVSVIKLPENACLCCIFDERRGRAESIAAETGIRRGTSRGRLPAGAPLPPSTLRT